MEHRHGLAIPRTLEEACDPARLALLIDDMQVGVLVQIRDVDRVLARPRRVLEAARAAGVRIVFLRHGDALLANVEAFAAALPTGSGRSRA